MQRAWIASRDATCEFYYHKIQGSMSVPMTAACLLNETARRALLLAAFGVCNAVFHIAELAPPGWPISWLSSVRRGAITSALRQDDHPASFRSPPMQFVEAHGARIPIVGFGSMRLKEEVGAQAIEAAIRNGYRHIDTAAFYGNESEVGRGDPRLRRQAGGGLPHHQGARQQPRRPTTSPARSTTA